MRWAARIISLLPGAGIILFYWGWGFELLITKGLEPWGLLLGGLELGLPLLIPGGISWRWPRVGSILQIVLAAFFFRLFIGTADLAPEVLLPIACAFLIGGILHLLVSDWGLKVLPCFKTPRTQ